MYIKKGNTIKYFSGSVIPNGWSETTLDEHRKNFSNTFSKNNGFLDKEKRKITIKINSIKEWMRNHDYIELQAVRGTISRESAKYIEYRNAYDEKLLELKSLEEIA